MGVSATWELRSLHAPCPGEEVSGAAFSSLALISLCEGKCTGSRGLALEEGVA